jgi:hypothetical protein
MLSFMKISRRSIIFYGAFLGLFPSSFFMVAGYSESMFMAALLGLIFWTERWLNRSKAQRLDLNWALAALCGFILSGTRLVGIPLMLYPVIRWISQQRKIQFDRRSLRVVILSGVSGLGALAFFVWSQIQFGQWDIYLKLQRLGWGNEPNYLAVLYPSSYLPRLFFEDTTTSVCRISNLLMFILFFRVIRNYNKVNWGVFYAAGSMFFVSLVGKANYNMDSMIRYNLPVFVLLMLQLISLRQNPTHVNQGLLCMIRKWAWILGCLLALAVQIWMIRVFTQGGWVA